jgi:hypothetical protein
MIGIKYRICVFQTFCPLNPFWAHKNRERSKTKSCRYMKGVEHGGFHDKKHSFGTYIDTGATFVLTR